MKILTGKEILFLATQGQIFRSNFKPQHCETSFYSLTLGNRVQSVTRRDHYFRDLDHPLILDPGEVMNVEIHERFNFNDAQGQPRYAGLIVSRARLLAGGISHPPTAVDPGATRATYLTLINHTNFPGPRMFPGIEKIAKMLVFAYLGDDPMPDAWEPTAPYVTVGEDDMPQFWPLAPEPWSPTTRIDSTDLDMLRDRFGTPYDIIAVGLSQLRDGMENIDREASVLQAGHSALADSVSELRERAKAADTRLDKLAEDVAFSKGEVSAWLRTRLEDAERLADRKRDSRRMRTELWVGLAVALVSAAFGVVLALYLK